MTLQVLSEEEAERSQSGLDALGVFLDTLLTVNAAQKAKAAGLDGKDQSQQAVRVHAKVELAFELA